MKFVAVLVLAAFGVAAALASGPVTILFIGNSFTFGDGSPVKIWRAASVNDLASRAARLDHTSALPCRNLIAC